MSSKIKSSSKKNNSKKKRNQNQMVTGEEKARATGAQISLRGLTTGAVNRHRELSFSVKGKDTICIKSREPWANVRWTYATLTGYYMEVQAFAADGTIAYLSNDTTKFSVYSTGTITGRSYLYYSIPIAPSVYFSYGDSYYTSPLGNAVWAIGANFRRYRIKKCNLIWVPSLPGAGYQGVHQTSYEPENLINAQDLTNAAKAEWTLSASPNTVAAAIYEPLENKLPVQKKGEARFNNFYAPNLGANNELSEARQIYDGMAYGLLSLSSPSGTGVPTSSSDVNVGWFYMETEVEFSEFGSRIQSTSALKETKENSFSKSRYGGSSFDDKETSETEKETFEIVKVTTSCSSAEEKTKMPGPTQGAGSQAKASNPRK
jgi:hypothetical protein